MRQNAIWGFGRISNIYPLFPFPMGGHSWTQWTFKRSC